MSAPRQPITASIVIVNQGKSQQEIIFYNLLYHRIRSMLPNANIEDIKKIVTGQIKAWERLNKKSYKQLMQQVRLLSPEAMMPALSENAEFGAAFDAAANQIAEMTNEVLNYGLPARLTHQYLLKNIRDSQKAVHRLQNVVRIDASHPLRLYLDMQDTYLNSISSTMFVVIGAINRFLATQEGDHSYQQSSDILIRLVQQVSGMKHTKKINEKLYNGIMKAVLPEIVAGKLTDQQSMLLKTAVKAVIQLVNDQNAAIGAFTKLSPESKAAVTRAGIVTKPVAELAMSIVYNPNDFIHFAIRQYVNPVFAAKEAAQGGARVVRDFIYNAARPLYEINIGFTRSNTARHLIREVYGRALTRVEFGALYDFHLFVVSVLGESIVPTQFQVEQLFEIYIRHNPTNEAISVAHYNYGAMVSLSERHPSELQGYVPLYQTAQVADRKKLLVKLMLDLNGIQRLFVSGGVTCDLISNRLSQIIQLQVDFSSLIDGYVVSGQGEQVNFLQNFSNNIVKPKIQLILIDLYKSILPDLCRDIMDAEPMMAVNDNERYQKLNIIFNKSLTGSALVSVDEIAWLNREYADHADEIVQRKIDALSATIKINRQQLNHEIEIINRDVRQGFPRVLARCCDASSSLPHQSFGTNPKLVTEPLQLRSRQAEEVNKIKETLEFIHPNFVFEALIEVLDKQIEECKQHEQDPAFAAKIAYCESLQSLIRTFLQTYCPGNPVDYTPLAEGMQQLISVAVTTTDQFTAQPVKQATPSLGFLFKLADHFSPANGVGDRNYMDLAISFILNRMDLTNVQNAYNLYQAMNIEDPTISLVGHIHQAQLENPLGTKQVVDGVVSGYVNRMADYLMSLNEGERLKFIGYIPGFSLLSKFLGDNVFNREIVAAKILEVIGFREKRPAVINQDKVIAKQHITRFLGKSKQQDKAADSDDPQYQPLQESLANFIGYIPGFNLLAAMFSDRGLNREAAAKKLMEITGRKKKKPVIKNNDNPVAQSEADNDSPDYQYFAATLTREKIKFRTKYAAADLAKLYALLAQQNDETFKKHRAIFFEAAIMYLTSLFNKSTKLQEKDPIAAMKLRDLVLAYLSKFEGLPELTKSQVDTIHANYKQIEDKVAQDVDDKVDEIKNKLIEVNQELGKAEAEHGVVREGVAPSPVNYWNITKSVLMGTFEIGTAAYAVYSAVSVLLPLFGTAATIASFASAFVGGTLAVIALRFAFYFVKGIWDDREKFREIWKTKEGEAPKKGLARVADVALKVRDTAALVARNLVVAVLKATLIYHVVNYISTIKALDVRNWAVFKAIKRRVQRRKVDHESIELKELARKVSQQGQRLLDAKADEDTKDAKKQFLELQEQLATFHARVKKALPVVQAALKAQIDALNSLQSQLEPVFRTRQIIREAAVKKQNAAPQREQAKKVEQALVVAPEAAKPAHIDLQTFLREVAEDESGKKYPQVYTNESPLPPEVIPPVRVIDAVVAGVVQPVQEAVVGGVANAAAFAAAKAAGAVDQGKQALEGAGQAIGGFFPRFFGQNPGNVAPQLPQAPLSTVTQPDVPSAPVQVEAMPVSDPVAQPTGSVSQIGIFAPDYVTSEQLAQRPADPTAATAAEKELNDKKAEELSWIRANK